MSGNSALFAGLVVDEDENPVANVMIGEKAFYVVDDAGFHRHIEAQEVDRRVLEIMAESV
jgi:hypothetical protein